MITVLREVSTGKLQEEHLKSKLGVKKGFPSRVTLELNFEEEIEISLRRLGWRARWGERFSQQTQFISRQTETGAKFLIVQNPEGLLHESPPVYWSCEKFSNVFSCFFPNQRWEAIISESTFLWGQGWPVCSWAMHNLYFQKKFPVWDDQTRHPSLSPQPGGLLFLVSYFCFGW